MKAKITPLEMVIMTVNRVDYLSKLVETINSSYDQLSTSEKNFLSIKISDNGSSDGTKEFLSKLSNEYNYFEIVTRNSTVNGAEHLALNLSECKSEYIWIVGDDDLFEKNCLANVINQIKSYCASVDVFLLNFKQVDKDGHTTIKEKISNTTENWTGIFNSESSLGSGAFNGIFDMFFFIGSVIYKRDLISLQPNDFDGTTDWEHLPVYLRSFLGKNIKVISDANIIQRQRNHKSGSKNEKENSYRTKDVSGLRRLLEKLNDIHIINKDSKLIYSMKAPYILHEDVYYEFIDFQKLVCHPGTIAKLEDPDHAIKILEDLYSILKILPRPKDQISILNYLRDLEEMHEFFKITRIKKKNVFEKMRLNGKKVNQ